MPLPAEPELTRRSHRSGLLHERVTVPSHLVTGGVGYVFVPFERLPVRELQTAAPELATLRSRRWCARAPRLTIESEWQTDSKGRCRAR